jgi:hypothetical protein
MEDMHSIQIVDVLLCSSVKQYDRNLHIVVYQSSQQWCSIFMRLTFPVRPLGVPLVLELI